MHELLGRYPPVFTQEPEGDWSVRFADFPGIVSGGETIDEALAQGLEALAGHIEALRQLGEPLPEPLREVRGVFQVRVPRSVHRALKRRAAEEGVSLNALVSAILSRETRQPDARA
ncbi:MAG: type II toxin-antitoxin system HicB family antitoxin [Armatimonadetes bacterium]|nr:type II toxin-antitoxin system HicB family antitoxin [Armatimonadota bacterium]